MCAAFVAAIVLLAAASGFQIADWDPYVRHVLDSVGGYAQAFALAGSGKRPALLVATVLLMLAIIVQDAWRAPKRAQPLLRVGFLAALVGLVVKAALVRQDPVHEMRAFAALGVLFACHVARHALQWPTRTKLLASLSAAGFAVLLAVTAETPFAIVHQAGELASFMRDGTTVLAQQDRLARAEAAGKVPRPWPPDSSVAAFGSYQSLLLGHRGHRVAMPFVASYEIWSPWASRRERKFLTGSGAPDYLLYTASPASAAVALALTARYEEVDRGAGYRLLRRREHPLPLTQRLLFAGDLVAAQRFVLAPQWRSRTLIAEVRYIPTLLTRAMSALYQPPQAFLVLFKSAEPYAKVRMNALLSNEGIVLSSAPGVWDGRPAALHGIRHGLLTDAHVEATAIGFEAQSAIGDGWERYFHPRVTVRLHAIEPGRSRTLAAFGKPNRRTRKTLSHEDTPYRRGSHTRFAPAGRRL